LRCGYRKKSSRSRDTGTSFRAAFDAALILVIALLVRLSVMKIWPLRNLRFTGRLPLFTANAYKYMDKMGKMQEINEKNIARQLF
jgi:hypothetical protein